MKITQFIRNLTIYCCTFRLNERLRWNMLQTTVAITTAESACPVIFAYEAFFKDIEKCYLYSLSHSYHRCSTERENMETNERRKKKITAEILNLSWGKLFFIIRPDKKVCVMYTTNGIITEVVECHECSNHRRSEMKYSSINKRLLVSVGWKGELVFQHWYFCKEANRRHIERQIFFIVIQIFRVASLSTLASNDIADSSVSLLSLLSSAVVSYQRVFLQPFWTFYFSRMKQQELIWSIYSPRVPDFCI